MKCILSKLCLERENEHTLCAMERQENTFRAILRSGVDDVHFSADGVHNVPKVRIPVNSRKHVCRHADAHRQTFGSERHPQPGNSAARV